MQSAHVNTLKCLGTFVQTGSFSFYEKKNDNNNNNNNESFSKFLQISQNIITLRC